MLVGLARGRVRSKYTMFAKGITKERGFEPPNPCPPGMDSCSTLLRNLVLPPVSAHVPG